MIHDSVTLKELKEAMEINMLEHLNIEITAWDNQELSGKMPVDHRTKQPMGLLHGGASVVLAESLGSIAANLVVDQKKYYCVGLEVNANHLKSAKSGYVYGQTKPLHIGKTTHVWQTEIVNEDGEKVCISRLTVAVMERR